MRLDSDPATAGSADRAERLWALPAERQPLDRAAEHERAAKAASMRSRGCSMMRRANHASESERHALCLEERLQVARRIEVDGSHSCWPSADSRTRSLEAEFSGQRSRPSLGHIQAKTDVMPSKPYRGRALLRRAARAELVWTVGPRVRIPETATLQRGHLSDRTRWFPTRSSRWPA